MESVANLVESSLQDLHQFVSQQVSESETDVFHVPSIVDSISQAEIDNFQPVHKRYYEEKYCTKFSNSTQNLDTCIKVHTNRVCIVYLADKHDIISKKQRIDRCNFQISSSVDRGKIQLSGKGKRGAHKLAPDSILCYVECGDNVYPVRAGINGKLLEINEEIKYNPNIIKEDNVSDGFIAIILPELKKIEKDLSSLLSREQYFS